MGFLVRFCAVPLLVSATAIKLHGQETLLSLRGIVRNESARPIEQAEIILDPGAGQRELRTDRDGQFRFLGVAAGPHRVRVLRIGFAPRDTTVTVSGNTTEIPISLERLTALSEVAVRTRPTGVYGTVVERDSLKPVAGARIELLGARVTGTTDAAGTFAMGNARAGTFMLRVSRDGYDSRMMSVRVPVDTGVGIDIVLRPGLASRDDHERMLLEDMAQRIHWKGVNAAVVGRDELLGRGSSLNLAIRFAPSFAEKSIVIDERACLFVNGLARPFATILDFSVEEIESIEVYAIRSELSNTLGKRWPRNAICGNPNARIVPGNRAQLISIWTATR